MKTIIVDNSHFHMLQLEFELAEFSQVELVGNFSSSFSALCHAEKHKVDLAYIKVGIPDMPAEEFAIKLRNMHSGVIVIFVSDQSRDIRRAITVDADYFIVRPYTHQNVESSVYRAVSLSVRLRKRVFIKTFGSFGVFVDGVPLRFSSYKAQELLAYLVDQNGNVVDTRKGFSVLWEDRAFSESSASCYRKVLSRLLYSLEDAGISNILRVYTRGRAINKDAMDCDYYSYLNGDTQVIRNWNGEYMSNYSWAEPTLGWITENRKRFFSYM